MSVLNNDNPLHKEFRHKLYTAYSNNKITMTKFNTQIKLNQPRTKQPFCPNLVNEAFNLYGSLLQIKLDTDSLTNLLNIYENLDVELGSKIQLLLHINNLIKSKEYQYHYMLKDLSKNIEKMYNDLWYDVPSDVYTMIDSFLVKFSVDFSCFDIKLNTLLAVKDKSIDFIYTKLQEAKDEQLAKFI